MLALSSFILANMTHLLIYMDVLSGVTGILGTDFLNFLTQTFSQIPLDTCMYFAQKLLIFRASSGSSFVLSLSFTAVVVYTKTCFCTVSTWAFTQFTRA